MKITRKDLRRKFQIIAKNYGLHSWRLEEWSPGDGWTRYKFTSNNNGSWDRSNNMTLHEAYEWLNGFARGLEIMQELEKVKRVS